MIVLFGFLIWIAILVGLSILVGKYAETKGRSFANWVIFSVFLTPLLGIICLLCVKDLNAEQQAQARARQQQIERSLISGTEFVTRVNAIANLYKSGMIEKQEYFLKRKQIFDSLLYLRLREPTDVFLAQLIPLKESGTISPEDVTYIRKIIRA